MENSISDEDATLAARHGWFSMTILPHERALRLRLRRLLRDEDQADDLAAETLARAYAASDFRKVIYGRSYLFRIARNLLVDQARRSKIVSLDLIADLDLLEADDRIEHQLEARDELRRLHAVVQALPDQCRRVFVMRRVEDKSVRQIAEELGLSVSTVEKHLTKAVTLVMRVVRESEGLQLERDRTSNRSTADRGRSR